MIKLREWPRQTRDAVRLADEVRVPICTHGQSYPQVRFQSYDILEIPSEAVDSHGLFQGLREVPANPTRETVHEQIHPILTSVATVDVHLRLRGAPAKQPVRNVIATEVDASLEFVDSTTHRQVVGDLGLRDLAALRKCRARTKKTRCTTGVQTGPSVLDESIRERLQSGRTIGDVEDRAVPTS